MNRGCGIVAVAMSVGSLIGAVALWLLPLGSARIDTIEGAPAIAT